MPAARSGKKEEFISLWGRSSGQLKEITTLTPKAESILLGFGMRENFQLTGQRIGQYLQ
jgi:hypothetical protein